MNAAAEITHPILKVDHLSMKFGGLVAIGDLSFEAKRGEITALIGPNGAGKTTVFNCITGFYKPTEGMITLTRSDGTAFLLERLPNHEIPARAKVARTFQNIRLFSGMTLLENLLVAQHNKLMKASGYTIMGLLGIGGYRKASAESVELAKFWLEKADLIDRADDPAGDLPYGAQRRLEIARAMCTGPELLCLDEPAAGLNPRESLALNTLLNDIKDNTGTSILLIEHDMSVVMQISDHVVVLEYGRKISDGDPASVKSDPRVIAAYLGVDDEEVVEVLTEVGDDQVIEQLDAEPDRAHGPGDSASMMAGSVTDTIAHSDDRGERITVSPGASKARQVDEREARAKAASAAEAEAKALAKKPSSRAKATNQAKVTSLPASLAAVPVAAPTKAKDTAKPAKDSATAAAKAAPKARASGNAAASKAKPAAKPAAAPTKATKATAAGTAASVVAKPAAASKSSASVPAAKSGPAKPIKAARPKTAKTAVSIQAKEPVKPSAKPAAKPAAAPTKAMKAAAAGTAASVAAKPAAASKSSASVPAAKSGPAEAIKAAKPKAVKAAVSTQAKEPVKPSAKPAAEVKPVKAGKAIGSAAAKPNIKSATKTGSASVAPAAKPVKSPAKSVASGSTGDMGSVVAATTPKAGGKPAQASRTGKAPGAQAPKASKPAAASAAAAPASGADDLLVIKGIGPVNARKLNEHGIFRFEQIAGWKAADVRAAEVYLEFDGRIAREDWVGQAKKLAKTTARAGTKAADRPAATKRGGKK